MATFWAKIPYRNIVSELDFFRAGLLQESDNKLTKSGTKEKNRALIAFEDLNFEGIIPCRSLEDGYRCDAVSTEIRTKRGDCVQPANDPHTGNDPQ